MRRPSQNRSTAFEGFCTRPPSCIGAILGILLAVAGCGGGGPPGGKGVDQQTRVAMNKISQFYGEYLGLHRSVPPRDAATFRTFLESRPNELKQRRIDDLNQLLKSPRDGQPYTIVCGKRRAPADAPQYPWAAYEQTGVDGKRMAVQVRGGAHELSQEEFAREFSAK